ncbi:MAG: Co2+/Mg2+ efflux protein ApaG [Ginsengibacter sp.]
MISKISEGVTVSVETFYQPEYSNPIVGDYMFAYRITLENHNSFPVQLLRRHWFIFDSISGHKEVEGDGVIGIQPIIDSGKKYQYMSGCNLQSDIGRMHGIYHMENSLTKKSFVINIPTFDLVVPLKLN